MKDREPDRMYVQVIEEWKQSPSVLAAQLPHRDPDDLQRLASRVAIITWTELLAVIEPQADKVEVLHELERRIS